MSPTRRDTLKAAGAASGLAVLGGHAVAQQDTPAGEDGPGAQPLEEGQAAVRVGHFVSGAPAVNVRLVPAEGTDTAESDDEEVGGNGTDDTGGNETGSGNTTGNTSDDNTTEDLQVGNDSNETDAGNETGDVGGNETDGDVGTPDDTTSDGEGQLVAENVSFGDVSEYATVEAGDYTVQLLAAEEEPDDTGTETGNTTGNTSDDNTSEDLQMGNDSNESDAGNGTGDGNESEDDMFSGGILDDDDNETASDNETGGMAGNETDTGNETGGMAGNETDGVGGNETDDDVEMPDDDSDAEVIYEEDVTVGETYYTVAAVGTGADDIDLHLLRDYDAAQVRLVHASPDAPGVDVVAPDASMTIFDDVTFGQATDYVGVPPGSYSLSVREAADMNDGDEVDSFDVEVESNEAYSVYAVGSPSGGEEEFDLVVQQDGQSAMAGMGQDDAPGQQGEPGAPGASGNETGGPGGDGPPGQDNESDAPGQSGGAGGPGDDNDTDNASAD